MMDNQVVSNSQIRGHFLYFGKETRPIWINTGKINNERQTKSSLTNNRMHFQMKSQNNCFFRCIHFTDEFISWFSAFFKVGFTWQKEKRNCQMNALSSLKLIIIRQVGLHCGCEFIVNQMDAFFYSCAYHLSSRNRRVYGRTGGRYISCGDHVAHHWWVFKCIFQVAGEYSILYRYNKFERSKCEEKKWEHLEK